jgi:hypothetical protein
MYHYLFLVSSSSSSIQAAFLVRLLLRYPQRELQVFKLANQVDGIEMGPLGHGTIGL